MIVFSEIQRCQHPHFTQFFQEAKKPTDLSSTYCANRPAQVPEGFDGLRDDWLPRSGKSRRVFLNPPFSRCDEWIDKAEKEHKQGVEILAVVSAQWINRTEGDRKLLQQHKYMILSGWQAQFFMPSSRYAMDPVDVYLLWFRRQA